jgi:anti-sigma B factor antagonist
VKRLMLKIRTAMANTAVSVIDMEGELDIVSTPDFEALLQDLFSQKRYKLVLNMKNLVYVSSNGFGAIESVIRDVRGNDGDIKFANVDPHVYEIIQILEFHKIFQILKTEDEAVRAFSKK